MCLATDFVESRTPLHFAVNILVNGGMAKVDTVLPGGSIIKVITISHHGVIVIKDNLRCITVSNGIHGEREIVLHITIDTIGLLSAHHHPIVLSGNSIDMIDTCLPKTVIFLVAIHI